MQYIYNANIHEHTDFYNEPERFQVFTHNIQHAIATVIAKKLLMGTNEAICKKLEINIEPGTDMAQVTVFNDNDIEFRVFIERMGSNVLVR